MIVKGIEGLSREEQIAYMIANKSDIQQMKKAAIKYADNPMLFNKALGSLDNTAILNDNIVKALSTSNADDTPDAIKRTIIGNTYLWMDSHADVHLGSTFTQSIKQRGDRVLHLHDHLYQITAKVGKPISVYEQAVKWRDLGVDKAGDTVALMMDTEILKSYNAQVYDQYKDNQIDQHSVGMYYVKVDLAADNEEYEEEYKLYTSLIDKLGNPERAKELGYFWAVKEAKLVEISAVLEGSNSLTPTVEAKDQESLDLEKADKAAKIIDDEEASRKEKLLKLIEG